MLGTRRIALTGGIATGKTYVRKQFEALGVPTLDSDSLARDAVAPGTSGLARVVERFGRSILGPDGSLDRRALGALVFSDARARLDLEAIVHPDVRAATERWFASLDGRHPFAIADIPLLYEVGRDRDFDKVIVVASTAAAQLARMIDRDGVSERDARQRLAAQLPIDDKARRADFVIRTDGTFEDTDRQVRAVLEDLAVSYRLPPTT
jgi:dephospho-CoA kinase